MDVNTNNEKKEPDGQPDFLNTGRPAEQDEPEQHRRGGPYTKEQQEERRKEVYNQHFKKHKSALEIAEILDVNRNTINEDIKILYSQISQEIGGTDLSALTVATLHRLELQRARVAEQLEKVTDFEERMRVEGVLYNINVKIVQITTKIVTSGKQLPTSYDSRFEEISEEEIREFVRDLMVSFEMGPVYKEEIEAEYIRKTKCTTSTVTIMMKKMLALGLSKCRIDIDINDKDWGKGKEKYHVVKFAIMRGYLTDSELSDIKNGK